MQVRKNLSYLIAQRDTNATALAAATGVPQPTIHRILSGESEDPRTATLQPLADHFGVTVEFLRLADIQSADAQPPHHEFDSGPDLRAFRNVPVVGTVEGGPDGYLEEYGHPVGHGEGLVEYPTKHESAYALRVRGESMHPRIRSGEFIVVEPDRPANPGDDVVVICRDGRKMVKQMLYQREGEVTLGSINDGFKPISLPIGDIEAIHYVAAIVPRGALYKPA